MAEILVSIKGIDELAKFGLLYLVTYVFLLRLPSEALPITVGRGSSSTAIYVEGSDLILELGRRCFRHHLVSVTVRVGLRCRLQKEQEVWEQAHQELLVLRGHGASMFTHTRSARILLFLMVGDLP